MSVVSVLNKQTRPRRKGKRWIVIALLVIFVTTILIHTNKKLPKGLSYESRAYSDSQVEFLYNASYERNGKKVFEDQIYKAWFEAVDNAEKWIILDMFMFAEFYDRDQTFPNLSSQLRDKLLERMEKHPDLKVVVIADAINTTYGSHPAKMLEDLKVKGAVVVLTDTDKLRDSNPLYSAAWRMFFQWFGQSGRGYFSNPFSDQEPKVTARSMLMLLNVKANHRKVLLTEKTGIVTSANAHDASYYHSNIAFRFRELLKEAVAAEQAVVSMSGGPELKLQHSETAPLHSDGTRTRLITEGKIERRVKEALSKTLLGDRISIGMFYLADREIVRELLDASERGVNVRLILDPNENAFGHQKSGLPNIPVTAELMERSEGKIQIRWYKTREEQYHTKLMIVERGESSTVIGGSANYTRRNLDNLNLEADLMITGPQNAEVMREVKAYFDRLWSNQDGVYTVPYEEHAEDMPFLKMAVYATQQLLGFTTFLSERAAQK